MRIAASSSTFLDKLRRYEYTRHAPPAEQQVFVARDLGFYTAGQILIPDDAELVTVLEDSVSNLLCVYSDMELSVARRGLILLRSNASGSTARRGPACRRHGGRRADDVLHPKPSSTPSPASCTRRTARDTSALLREVVLWLGELQASLVWPDPEGRGRVHAQDWHGCAQEDGPARADDPGQ